MKRHENCQDLNETKRFFCCDQLACFNATVTSQTNFSGLTGPMQFDNAGYRINFKLNVLSITYSGLKKVNSLCDLCTYVHAPCNMFEIEPTSVCKLLCNTILAIAALLLLFFVDRRMV